MVNKFLFLGICLLASALPDIDTGKSFISKRTKLVSWVFRIFQHRGIFHSLAFALGLSYVLFFLGQREIAFGLFIGYIGHLFLDSLTKEGIQFLYPLPIRFKGFLRTNSFSETIFFYTLLGIATYFVLGYFKIFDFLG